MPRDSPAGDSLGGMNRGGVFGRAFARSTVGAGVEQQRRDLEMPVAGRDHQRRLAEVLVARVDGGAVLEQRSRELGVAGARGKHQRRLARAVGRRGVGAGLEQPARQRRVAGFDRECSGRTP